MALLIARFTLFLPPVLCFSLPEGAWPSNLSMGKKCFRPLNGLQEYCLGKKNEDGFGSEQRLIRSFQHNV